MVAQTVHGNDISDFEESEQFEKIGRRSEWGMPSRRAVSVKRALRRTSASRRANHKISAKAGGKHHRRLKRIR